MSKHDYRRSFWIAREIGFEPSELFAADFWAAPRDVVERNKMNTLVIEGIVALAEMFPTEYATVECRIIFAGYRMDRRGVDAAGNRLEGFHPLSMRFAALRGALRRVSGRR